MKYAANRQQGFTLIEMILSLVLLGILAAMGMGAIATAGKSVITTRDAVDLSMTSQVAMNRLNRDFSELKSAGSHTPTSFSFVTSDGPRNIRLSGTQLLLGEATAPSDKDGVLLDNVTDFKINLYNDTGAWNTGDPDNNLTAIDVSITLKSPQIGVERVFTRRFVPRNNANTGGAPATGGGGKYGSGCLVTVAAPKGPGGGGSDGSGGLAAIGMNSEHKPAHTLRRFRDVYLLSWEGGRHIAAMYYEVSPPIAHAISNNETARFVVWQMIKVAAVLAEISLDAPCLLLAFILLIIFHKNLLNILKKITLFRREQFMLQHEQPYNGSYTHVPCASQGSVLLIALGAIVVFSLLAVLLINLMSSSRMASVAAQRGEQAYYLAEAGFNVLSSSFMQKSSALEKENYLESSNLSTYDLKSNKGKFSFNIVPYWFRAKDRDTGKMLEAHVFGTPPTLALGSSDKAFVRFGESKQFRPIQSFSIDGAGGKNGSITFHSKDVATERSKENDQVYLAVQLGAQPLQTTVLDLPAHTGGLFPKINGAFTLKADKGVKPFDGTVAFSYATRDDDTLKDVKIESSVADMGPLDIPENTYLTLEAYAVVKVTGEATDGITRSITFNTPISDMSGGGTPDSFTKENIDVDWTGSTPIEGEGKDIFQGEITDDRFRPKKLGYGTYKRVEKADGSSCFELSVQDTEHFALTMASNTVNGEKFVRQHQNTHGYLSYDVQVKVAPDQLDERFIVGPVLRLKANKKLPAKVEDYDFVALSLVRISATRMTYNTIIGSNYVTSASWMINQKILQGVIPGVPPGKFYDKGDFGYSNTPLFKFSTSSHKPSGSGGSSGSGLLPGGVPYNYNLREREAFYYPPGFSSHGATFQISYPAILLWEQVGGVRRWLAYKVLTEPDASGLRSGADDGGTMLNVSPKDTINTEKWSTLVARVSEGNLTEITKGEQRIANGTKLLNKNTGDSAYTLGQPFVTKDASWTGKTNGVLTLGIPGASLKLPKDELHLAKNNTLAAQTKSQEDKGTFIRVYYSTTKPQGAPSANPIDHNRREHTVGDYSYMQDDYSTWNSGTDNFTLMQWDDVNTGVIGYSGETFATPSAPASKVTLLKLNEAFNSPEYDPDITIDQLPVGFGIFSYGAVCINDYRVQHDSYTPGSSGGGTVIPPVRD